MAVKKTVKKAAPKKTAPAKKKAPVKSSAPAPAPKKKEAPPKKAVAKKATKSEQSSSAVEPGNELGKKFTCYNCGTKFYDLNKPEKLCPKCGSDQMAKPALKSRQAALRANDYEVDDEETAPVVGEEEEAFIDEEEVDEVVEEDSDEAVEE